MNTYNFSKPLSEALNTPFFPISDQEIKESFLLQEHEIVPGTLHPDICKAISEACKGRPAHNKGKPNPIAREYMLSNNPMKNPVIIIKQIETRRKNHSWVDHEGMFKKGHKPNNYVDEIRTFSCETCGTQHTVRNIRDNKTRRFCNRSCQATFSNRNRRLSDETKRKISETKLKKNQISQPEAAEHASSCDPSVISVFS